ncbi:hypothetical protein D3C71_1906210 [compost metagenome]
MRVNSRVDISGARYESAPSIARLPCLVAWSQAKKASPTGPRPSAMIAAHWLASGQTLVSSSRWQISPASATNPHMPPMMLLGTSLKRRLITE